VLLLDESLVEDKLPVVWIELVGFVKDSLLELVDAVGLVVLDLLVVPVL